MLPQVIKWQGPNKFGTITEDGEERFTKDIGI